MNVNINIQSIILIILGILAIIFPMTAMATVDFIICIALIFVAVFLISFSIPQFSVSKIGALLYLILAIVCLILAYCILFNPVVISSITSFLVYIFGIALILFGILALIFNPFEGILSAFAVSSILFGIIYLIVSIFLFNPFNLGIVIGVWLLFSGVLALFY